MLIRIRTVLLLVAASIAYFLIRDTALSVNFRLVLTGAWQWMHQSLFHKNDYLTISIGTYILLQLIFVCSNQFFVLADLTDRPGWLKKYKIQEGKNNPLDAKKFFKALKLVLFNQLVIYVFVVTIFGYFIVCLRNVPCDGEALPTIPQLSLHLLVSIITEEIGFYYIHRLFHHPILYARFHKIHHEWHAPVSITQLYCHPLEHFLLNSFTTTFGTMLLGDRYGNHLISFWVWLIIMKGSSAIVHSGYHLPFLPSSQEHDYHHSRFNQNFGTIGVLDYIHGTSGSFMNSIAYERHTFLLGLSSARELIPDHVTKK